MDALIQKLHPSLRVGQRLALSGCGSPIFSGQGDWDSGSASHCVAMALALLGKLSDPVDVRRSPTGPEAEFWDRAWPHYLHGLRSSELVSFILELNAGVRPGTGQCTATSILRFCERELANGWPVIVRWRSRHPPQQCAALALGVGGVRRERVFSAHELLLLDPAGTEPQLATCNGRLEFDGAQRPSRVRHVTATSPPRRRTRSRLTAQCQFACRSPRRNHRSRLRLISGGVAALARRTPVGSSDTLSSGANSSESVTFSAWQMFASVSIDGFAMPRSIAEI